MKTIKLKEQIIRVSDDVAENLVRTEGWQYVPKSLWKEKNRENNTIKIPKSKKAKLKRSDKRKLKNKSHE